MEQVIPSEIPLEIPRISDDPLTIPLKMRGDQLFLVGANGSGKSALIQRFASILPREQVKRITAHRQTWLNSGSIDFTQELRRQYQQNQLNYNSQPDSRWRDFGGAQDLSAILFDLVAKENIRARSIARHVDNREIQQAEEISRESSSPFDQINDLLSRATLTVTIENPDDRELLARHPHSGPFSIAKMSDGERNAMIIASQVITAEPGTLFLIDEPERHLHRSIIEPFFSELFALRPDCTFIISTHEIALPVANPEARVLMLRSCRWAGDHCEAWDVEVLEPNTQLPEDLKLAILGSRKRILFVEGNSNSLDFPLYSALFPNLSVVPKGSCEEVQKAVFGIRESQDMHDFHVEALGLIDRDNRSDKDVEKLAKKGVFALKVWEVESLYYCSDAIAAVACRQAESVGDDSNEFIKSAKQKAIDSLKRPKERTDERMAARRYERQIHEQFLSKIPNWKSIMGSQNPDQPITVTVDSSYSEELNLFKKLVDDGEWDQLVARYPLCDTGAFEIIAKVLKCQDHGDYERMVIVQIQKNEGLAKALKDRIGPLAEKLDQA